MCDGDVSQWRTYSLVSLLPCWYFWNLSNNLWTSSFVVIFAQIFPFFLSAKKPLGQGIPEFEQKRHCKLGNSVMAAQAVHYCTLLCNVSTTPEPIHGTSFRIGQKLFWTLQKHKVSIKHQSISSRHVYLHCVSNLTHPKSLSQTFKHRRQHLSAREISRIQDLTLFSQLFSDGHRTKVFTSLCLLCLIRNWLWDSSGTGDGKRTVIFRSG